MVYHHVHRSPQIHRDYDKNKTFWTHIHKNLHKTHNLLISKFSDHVLNFFLCGDSFRILSLREQRQCISFQKTFMTNQNIRHDT